jgi:hypothetical protein
MHFLNQKGTFGVKCSSASTQDVYVVQRSIIVVTVAIIGLKYLTNLRLQHPLWQDVGENMNSALPWNGPRSKSSNVLNRTVNCEKKIWHV